MSLELPVGTTVHEAKKKILFVSCNGLKKNRVGRLVKKKFCMILLVKNVCFMHVLR